MKLGAYKGVNDLGALIGCLLLGRGSAFITSMRRSKCCVTRSPERSCPALSAITLVFRAIVAVIHGTPAHKRYEPPSLVALYALRSLWDTYTHRQKTAVIHSRTQWTSELKSLCRLLLLVVTHWGSGTVNHRVGGSSPSRGAIYRSSNIQHRPNPLLFQPSRYFSRLIPSRVIH